MKHKRAVVCARITILDANSMERKRRHSIAEWLRTNANDLEKIGACYAPRYTARYWVQDKKKGKRQ